MSRPFNSRLRLKPDQLAAFAVTVAPVFYFLPALLHHLVLGPDDGMLFNVPLRVTAANILRSGSLPLWNPYIFGGMPLFATAQGGLLFPLNWFYLIFSPAVATDLMVVSTYMVAALGAYLFARRIEQSIAGAVVTSLVWQFGSFLIGQVSHINIVHTAALLPWVLWALQRYVENGSRRRGALLALLVAIQIFAGHQQTFVYTFLLVCAYAIIMALVDSQFRKRYLKSLAFIGTGVMLAAVQILPTFELLRNSPRATATYDFFSSFSMPVRFVSTFLAPYVMGGGDGRLFRAPYIGQAYYTEYVAYAGVLAMMLVLSSVVFKPDKRTMFWVVAGLVGLLLAFGRDAPFQVYRLIYYVPVLNLFRVPARHLVEVNFAVAILAGRGLTVLSEMRGVRKTATRVAIIAATVFLLTCLTVTFWRPANFELFRKAPVSLLRAPELFLPIVFAGLSAWAIWAFTRRWRGATAFLLTVLVVDLVMWGQFSGWYTSCKRIPAEYWGVPESVTLLRDKAPKDLSSYRILTSQQTFDPRSSAHSSGWLIWTEPDIYSMYGISNAAGYDGFGLERYSELAGQMKLWGELTDPNATLRGNSREIDLLNVRYLIARTEDYLAPATDSQSEGVAPPPSSVFPAATEQIAQLMFAKDDLSLPNIGPNKRLSFRNPPVEVDQVALITNLSWAEAIPDGTTVGWLRLRATGGRTFEFPLRAGVETADWVYDRPDIRARIRHKRPALATNYDVSDAQYKYQGHKYVTSVNLPERVAIESGEIVLVPQKQSPDLFLSVFRISLMDKNLGKSYALDRKLIEVESNAPNSSQSNPGTGQRWTLLAEGQHFDIYENSRALPRAWLTTNTRVLDESSMLQVIRTAAFQDGTKWDPLTTALLETPARSVTGLTSDGAVEITSYEPGRVNLKARVSVNSILVLSENHYPGWRVYIDGKSADMLRVNYGLRGVEVTPGNHDVIFVYRPWSVLGGALISLMSLLVLGVCANVITRERLHFERQAIER